MYLILAPMHGYADALMRDTLTQIGGYDEVVSEFVRITHTIHSPKTWFKNIPELKNNGKTLSNVPCTVQLLGSDAENLATNALIAIECGAKKIDLNFGCPAKGVNQHLGGAILLNNPKLIEHIVYTVRRRLPENIILSAKMRLGFNNCNLALDCARAITHAGANQLTVHARTKLQAYDPPAHWEYFHKIQKVTKIPLVVNGDIFSVEDVRKILQICEPSGFMLGRGALRQPDLALQITKEIQGVEYEVMSWAAVLDCLSVFYRHCQKHRSDKIYANSRLKQWLNMLSQHYPAAQKTQQIICQLNDSQAILEYLQHVEN